MATNSSHSEVYQKTSNILRAIEECGCSHCLSILKSGLREPTPNPTVDADTTNPEYKSGVSYTDG